jgi:hypothetical protein
MTLNKDEKAFLKVYNDRTTFPTTEAVAAHFGVALQTVKNKAVQLRKKAPDAVISRVHYSVPMSEDASRFREDWTAEDCIEELRRVASLDEDQVVSRNYFRVHSEISESTWNRYFGTFEEFKRQAGLKLTRQQHALERHIAKHASVDHYRALNRERQDYAGRYVRTKPGRFKTVIIASDLHDEEMDPFFRRVLIDTIKRVQPDAFCIGGDGLDLPEFGKYSVDPREWGPTRRIRHMHAFCNEVRNVAPDAQFDWLEGNHEFRLLRHLGDETPALKAVLAELHGMTIRQLLGLDRFEVNYIAKADLAAYRERDIQKELGRNYHIYFDSLLVHHFPEGRQMGMPGVNGHHHKHISWPSFSPVYGAFEWHQLGCGHKRDASYCAGEKWHMGFMIANIDTQTRQVNFDYVPVTDFAVSGGTFYHRQGNEVVAPETRILLGA